MDNIIEVFAEIFENEELAKKFMQIDDLEEMYRFCLSIKGGYTRQEFEIFLESLVRVSEGKSPLPYTPKTELDDDEIELVSGGISPIKKLMVGGLAAASLFSSGMSTFATPASTLKASNSISKKVSKKSEVGDNSWWITKKIKGIGRALWNHKGKITLGLASAALFYYVYKHWGNTNAADMAKINEKIRKQEQERLKNVFNGFDLYYSQDKKLSSFIAQGQDKINIADDKGRLDKDENFQTLLKVGLIKPVSDQNGTVTDYRDASPSEAREVLASYEKDKAELDSGWFSHLMNKAAQSLPSAAWAGSSLLALGGGLLSLGSGALSFVDGKMKFFETMEKGLSSIGRMVSNFAYSMSNYSEKMERKPFDKDEKNQELIESLEEVRGQEHVKQKVKGFFQQVVTDRLRREATNEKGKAKVIVFNGPSGTGKSFTATKLAAALTNAEPYVMSASEVDVNRGSIVEQLFAKSEYDTYSWMNSSERGFARYIKDHSTDGVVIINEYDKMYDGKGGNHPLDETLRSFIDEGKAVINGQEYDCSGITFILTTNETSGSLKGLVTSDKKGSLIDPTVDHDNTGSRTVVKHDKSFLNRLTIAEFDNLTKNEYEQISKDKFAPTLEFLETEKGGGVTVNISDASYAKMGEFLEKVNEGARPIDSFIGGLFVEIVNKVTELQENNKDSKDITMNAEFEFNEKGFRFNVDVVEPDEASDEEQSEQAQDNEQDQNDGQDQHDEQNQNEEQVQNNEQGQDNNEHEQDQNNNETDKAN